MILFTMAHLDAILVRLEVLSGGGEISLIYLILALKFGNTTS